LLGKSSDDIVFRDIDSVRMLRCAHDIDSVRMLRCAHGIVDIHKLSSDGLRTVHELHDNRV
jgi:aryl carrier-like protein